MGPLPKDLADRPGKKSAASARLVLKDTQRRRRVSSTAGLDNALNPARRATQSGKGEKLSGKVEAGGETKSGLLRAPPGGRGGHTKKFPRNCTSEAATQKLVRCRPTVQGPVKNTRATKQMMLRGIENRTQTTSRTRPLKSSASFLLSCFMSMVLQSAFSLSEAPDQIVRSSCFLMHFLDMTSSSE